MKEYKYSDYNRSIKKEETKKYDQMITITARERGKL